MIRHPHAHDSHAPDLAGLDWDGIQVGRRGIPERLRSMRLGGT